MSAETTGRYVVLNGTKLYELTEYPEFGTQEYLDLPDAEARTRDCRYLDWRQVDELQLEILEEVKVPTGIGAVVVGVGIKIGVEGVSPAGFETRYVKLGELHNGWVSLEGRFYKDCEVQWVLANGGKVLSEGVEV